MRGINRTDGTALEGKAHLKQSLEVLLTTRVGTRVMRRNYGSDLPDLVDAPLNADTLVDLYAATAGAIAKWEPRFSLQSVSNSVSTSTPHKIALDLTGIYLPDGETVTVEGVTIS